MYVCTFQPGNCTGWGSEGVNSIQFNSNSVFLNDPTRGNFVVDMAGSSNNNKVNRRIQQTQHHQQKSYFDKVI